MRAVSELWNAIGIDVCTLHGVDHNYFHKDGEFVYEGIGKARQHAFYLLLIELMLDKHRKLYAIPYEPLNGIDALHHKLFMKTGWSLGEVKSIDLKDIVFLLLDEIKISSSDEKFHVYLDSLKIYEFAEKPKFGLLDDWNPSKYDDYTKKL